MRVAEEDNSFTQFSFHTPLTPVVNWHLAWKFTKRAKECKTIWHGKV